MIDVFIAAVRFMAGEPSKPWSGRTKHTAVSLFRGISPHRREGLPFPVELNAKAENGYGK